MLNAAERDPRCAVRIRVFLIDAEVVVRAGMRLLINSWKNCEVVGEADASSRAISALEAAAPDLIVLSDREFSQNGDSTDPFGGFNKLVQAAGTAPLLLMTNSRNSRLGAHAIKLGAKGIVSTRDAPRELHTAIDCIFAGDMWVSRSALRGLASSSGEERRTESDAEGSLTNRECEVAALVGGGCTDRQVSSRLGITELTVRNHLSSIFNKLGIANRFELIVWAYRRRLIVPGALVAVSLLLSSSVGILKFLLCPLSRYSV